MQSLIHTFITGLFAVGLIAALMAFYAGFKKRRSQKPRSHTLPCALALMMAGLLFSASSYAAETQMSEREHLARLVHELNALKPILVQAQRAPKDPGRERFKYRAMNRDLKLMIDGLEGYIYRVDEQPRTSIEPLSGGYVE